MSHRIIACILFLLPILPCAGETPGADAKPSTPADAPAAKAPRKISPELKAALEKLALPGVKLNIEEWSVDVDSKVCLREGLLELIACTKDSKEHESIIMIEAKPSHVHTALLLLGAKPGRPATQEAIDPEMTRWRSFPPSGGPIDVFLVITDAAGKQTEHPISDFIARAEGHDWNPPADDPSQEPEEEKFPTHTFVFAGSHLVGEGEGPRRYLCDLSGNVISITTFGDELLCLPGFHDNSNGALMWQVDGEKLPEIGSKVILRLRPRIEPAPAESAAPPAESPAESPAGPKAGAGPE
jgi:hypothetical protein